MPCALWGLRLGGLLAADVVASGAISPSVLLLWQPVIAGRSFFNQFLRLATAQQLTGRSEGSADAKSLRATLDSGSSVEVAGYDLNPALVAGAEAIELSALVLRACPIIWRETTVGDPPAISPSAAKIAASWTEAGSDLDIAAVSGPSFWATQEIAEAPELIAATSRSLVEQLIAPTGGVS
jgi:exosortase A-associated hydrolase 2